MNDLLRLKEDATDFERRLLDSASEDVPSHEAKQRTLAVIGLVGTGGAIAGATKLGHLAGGTRELLGSNLSAGTAGASSGGLSVAAGKVAGLALAKWLVGGAFTFVLALGAWHWTQASNRPVAQQADATHAAGETVPKIAAKAPAEIPPAPSRISPTESVPGNAAASPAEPVEEKSVKSPTPVAAAVKKTARHSSSYRRSSAVSKSTAVESATEPAAASVLEEVRSLDSARRALAGGSPAEALSVLTNHEQRFASGTLAPEARVLRIRALLQLGRRAEAENLANEFLARHPRSPHAAQVRDLLSHR